MQQRISTILEEVLGSSFHIILISVLASLFLSLAMFYIATVDVVDLALNLRRYADLSIGYETRTTLRAFAIGQAITILDTYLMGTIMLIFASGMYDLFIRRKVSYDGERGILGPIESLEQLKDRLTKAVLLVLQIEIAKYVLRLQPQNPLDVLITAGIILVLAVVVYLGYFKPSAAKDKAPVAVPKPEPVRNSLLHDGIREERVDKVNSR